MVESCRTDVCCIGQQPTAAMPHSACLCWVHQYYSAYSISRASSSHDPKIDVSHGAVWGHQCRSACILKGKLCCAMQGQEFSCYTLAHKGRVVAHADTPASLSNLNYGYTAHPGIRAWVQQFVSRSGVSGQVRAGKQGLHEAPCWKCKGNTCSCTCLHPLQHAFMHDGGCLSGMAAVGLITHYGSCMQVCCAFGWGGSTRMCGTGACLHASPAAIISTGTQHVSLSQRLQSLAARIGAPFCTNADVQHGCAKTQEHLSPGHLVTAGDTCVTLWHTLYTVIAGDTGCLRYDGWWPAAGLAP